MSLLTLESARCAKQSTPHTDSDRFSELSDEELCRNAQRGCVASRDLLWLRYDAFIQRIAGRERRRSQLPHNEITDALQELYFAFHEAVQRYAPETYCQKKPASFKTFLQLIVMRKFSSYCARYRSYSRRIALGLDDEVLPRSTLGSEASDFPYNGTNGNGHFSIEWQRILQSEHFSDDLAEAMQKLSPKERHLLEVWLHFGRDKLVAQVLGVSVAAAKLRRGRLFRRLRQGIATK